QQWNLDLQRELPFGIFLDIAYAGSHGVHLQQYNTQINQIADSYLAQAASQYQPGTADPNANVTIAQTLPAAAYPFVINGVAGSSLPGALGIGNLKAGQLDRP